MTAARQAAAPVRADKAAMYLRADGTGQAATIAFLSDPHSYPDPPTKVEIIETHMSLVFIVGDLVFKMKRAVQLCFADARRPESRREFCRREVELNRALAPGVYLRVASVNRAADGTLSLDGPGEPVEWLVVMRHLDPVQSLDQRIVRGHVAPAEIDSVGDLLAGFYVRQPPAPVAPDAMVELWQEAVGRVEFALTDRQFRLDAALVDPPVSLLIRFVQSRSDLIRQRVEAGRIVDGHGDLKPEHIHFGPPIRVIDRIEFDERLRWRDPFDEVSYLGMECEKLGAGWIGRRLTDNFARGLGERPPAALMEFYHCYNACLRARLSIEHLLDKTPRTPERWPRQTRAYLRLAMAHIGA